MNCSVTRNNHSLRILAIALVLMMLASVLPISCALGECNEPDEVFTMDEVLIYLDGDDGCGELVPLHTVTSVGRENVKLHGVKSKNQLKEYTIPDELLMADSNFAALMMEADKYIGRGQGSKPLPESWVTVNVEGKPVGFMVDTGAQYSVLNQKDGPMSKKSSWEQPGLNDMDGLQNGM